MGLEKIEEQLENFEMVKVRIRQEGFHYCFKNYSSFEEVEDERFHELRKLYLQVAETLEKYVDSKIEELSDKLLSDEE